MYKIENLDELFDFVYGCSLFGCGGGGSPSIGTELLTASFKKQSTLTYYDIDYFDDEDWICTAFYMGSIAPQSEIEKEKMIGRGQTQRRNKFFLEESILELEKELGVTFSAIIAEELGGINAVAPFAAATNLNKKFIDGDFAGRAVPEATAIYPRILDLKMCPVACCDVWGNKTIIRESHSYELVEVIGKMLSVPAGEPIGLAGFAMQINDAKRALSRNTLSKAQNIGKLLRETDLNKRSFPELFSRIVNGKWLFSGTVNKMKWKNEDGYMIGNFYLCGINEFLNHTLKMWFKNENHIAWIDDIVQVTSPDLIQILDSNSGLPVTNDALTDGQSIDVIAIPNERYRTPAGIDVLGPHHFGYFDITYQPF
ncbi:DUF917 domain-containing protein [Listeria seeligeri]|uniref:DUF917 domain-containing protein n=1 Tax=Listeria seeligeri TaxID=1640 RepID=UPI0030CE27F0